MPLGRHKFCCSLSGAEDLSHVLGATSMRHLSWTWGTDGEERGVCVVHTIKVFFFQYSFVQDSLSV